MELVSLKEDWNQILDFVLERDRIAWLAFFDARLVSLDKGVLVINFSDSQKLGGQHDFHYVRNPKHLSLLHEAITSVLGRDLEIIEE
jgi:hypothetical protein